MRVKARWTSNVDVGWLCGTLGLHAVLGSVSCPTLSRPCRADRVGVV